MLKGELGDATILNVFTISSAISTRFLIEDLGLPRWIANKIFEFVNKKVKKDSSITRLISYIRRTEDLAFVEAVNGTLIDLDFPEAPLRGMVKKYGVVRAPVNTEEEAISFVESQEIFHKVADRLGSFLKMDWDLILLPIAIGNHIDHLIVHFAAKKALSSYENVMFYEDCPYAGRISMKEVDRVVKERLGEKATPVVIGFPKLFGRWKRVFWYYRSQIEYGWDLQLEECKKRYGIAERLWKLPETKVTLSSELS